MSPSITPIASSPASSSSVDARMVVLPDPGELIRLTVRIPLLSKAARLASASRSFSAKIDSSTSMRCAPVP